MIGRIPLEGIPLALSCSASSRLCADSLDRWAWGPSLKPGGDVRHAVAKIDHRGAQRAQRNYSAFGAPSAQSLFLCALCILCGEASSAGHGLHRPISKPEPIGVHPPLRSPLRRGKSAAKTSSPLGMGSIDLAAGWTPVGNLSLISRFVPVLKTRTFRLQTGTKPVRCSFIARSRGLD
jgi:hypothetical protein